MKTILHFALLPLLLGAVTTGGAQVTSIRQIDFKNFTYAWDDPSNGVPESLRWITSSPKSHIEISNGIHHFYEEAEDDFEREFAPLVSVDSIVYGDLVGDGDEEAVVSLNYSTGGTANWDYLYVYTLKSGAPALLGRMETGSRGYGGLIKATVENGLLVVDIADKDRRVGDCCSEGYIRLRYRWQRGGFVETGTRERGDVELRSAAPQDSPTRPQTFHVRGTIKDPLAGVIPGVKVTFQSELLTTTVTTNNVGVYEADLPLGDYTMTAQGPRGFRLYRRPLFRVTSPVVAIVNATLLVGVSCDLVVANGSEEPGTNEQWKAAAENCRHEELIQIPSGDGIPFQLSILYGSRTPVGSTYSYIGEKTPQYEAPVFVAYNLFSLQADKVTYDVEKRTIEASGKVIAVDELGTSQRADSMVFKIENCQVVTLRYRKNK
jgi:hypothetical protein